MTRKIGIPICWYCKYFDNDAWKQNFRNHKCAAFSDNIPPEIWIGEFDHTLNHENDNGIVFEKADTDALLIQKTGFNKSNIDQIDAVIDRNLQAIRLKVQAIANFKNENSSID